MKKTFAILSVALVMLAGCSYMRNALGKFRADNPEVSVLPIDEDNDGIPEAYGIDKDKDGQVDTLPNGKPHEVPGTRQASQTTAQLETDLVEIAGLLGALAGFPVVGVVSAWVGRRKPLQRFDALVTSIDRAKQENSPDGVITLSKATLFELQKEIPGLLDAISKAKKKN